MTRWPLPLGASCACGEALWLVPAGRRDWQWMDGQGRTWVDTSPPGHAEDPKGWWDRLAKADIALYSRLACRQALGMLSFVHHHRPVHQLPSRRPVPRCCGEPMRAIPIGWECRVTRVVFDAG